MLSLGSGIGVLYDVMSSFMLFNTQYMTESNVLELQ